MGKSKKRKGKGGKKGKGSKKKGKKVVEEEPGPPPELDTFVYIRRKNLTLCLETFEDQTIKELKIQVATILRQFAEDITLYSTIGKKGEEEMLEREKPKKEADPKKKEEPKGKRRSSGSSRGGRKSKDKEKEKPEKKDKEKESNSNKPPADLRLVDYGYGPKTGSIFKPAVIGLAYRADDGEFEPLDFTPYTEFPVIPEEIKMHLRNYVPPPPPPPKKGPRNK